MTNIKKTSSPSSLSTSRRGFVVGAGALMVSSSLPAFAAANLSLQHIATPRYLGAADAPIQIAEYFSMTCSHCANFHRDTFGQIKKNLIETGQVRYEMRPFPLDGAALRAHVLARIVPIDGYYAMVDHLLAQQSSWARANDPLAVLAKYAHLAGVSKAEFYAAMRDKPLLEAIVAEKQKGIKRWKISSTPSFVVDNKKMLSGGMSYEKLLNELAPLGI